LLDNFPDKGYFTYFPLQSSNIVYCYSFWTNLYFANLFWR